MPALIEPYLVVKGSRGHSMAHGESSLKTCNYEAWEKKCWYFCTKRMTTSWGWGTLQIAFHWINWLSWVSYISLEKTIVFGKKVKLHSRFHRSSNFRSANPTHLRELETISWALLRMMLSKLRCCDNCNIDRRSSSSRSRPEQSKSVTEIWKVQVINEAVKISMKNAHRLIGFIQIKLSFWDTDSVGANDNQLSYNFQTSQLNFN